MLYLVYIKNSTIFMFQFYLHHLFSHKKIEFKQQFDLKLNSKLSINIELTNNNIYNYEYSKHYLHNCDKHLFYNE